MTAYDDTRDDRPETPADDAEVAPPAHTPDATTDPDIDEIREAEIPDEVDPYQLRSGVPEGAGSDSDPASQLNF